MRKRSTGERARERAGQRRAARVQRRRRERKGGEAGLEFAPFGPDPLADVIGARGARGDRADGRGGAGRRVGGAELRAGRGAPGLPPRAPGTDARHDGRADPGGAAAGAAVHADGRGPGVAVADRAPLPPADGGGRQRGRRHDHGRHEHAAGARRAAAVAAPGAALEARGVAPGDQPAGAVGGLAGPPPGRRARRPSLPRRLRAGGALRRPGDADDRARDRRGHARRARSGCSPSSSRPARARRPGSSSSKGWWRAGCNPRSR